MDRVIRWGILGPGNIANKFAESLKNVPNAELKAVGSRSIERSNQFGDKFNIEKRYGSYEELTWDPEVDVIYVATPHVFHKEHSLLCLKNGKAVLCEKPFAMSAMEAKEIVNFARESKIFLMEAMWTRFLPGIVKVRELLKDGIIGDVKMVTADFGFRASYDPSSRLLNPDLGGGALLDVGIYTVSLASMIFGKQPDIIKSTAYIGDTGVDEQSAFIFGYDEGSIGVLISAINTTTAQEARIMGTKGCIHIPEFWHGSIINLEIYGKGQQRIDLPYIGIGYSYEAIEVMDCLNKGKLESNIMGLDETVAIMETMDKIRALWNLKYPSEL